VGARARGDDGCNKQAQHRQASERGPGREVQERGHNGLVNKGILVGMQKWKLKVSISKNINIFSDSK
jgi:hypothetical protein